MGKKDVRSVQKRGENPRGKVYHFKQAEANRQGEGVEGMSTPSFERKEGPEGSWLPILKKE